MAAEPELSKIDLGFPNKQQKVRGRERAVSQAISNFDLFQLDGNSHANMRIERVTVVKARWQRFRTVVDGVRYFEIQTVIKSLGSAPSR